jgi:hypothetical protein
VKKIQQFSPNNQQHIIMKLTKILVASGLLSAISHAATITISPGIGASNGLLVQSGGVTATQHYVSIGAWNGTTFTQFASTQTDTGTVNGAFTATTPSSANGQTIHLYVSLTSGISFNAADNWVLFRTSGNTAFPADVSSALASQTATFSTHTTAVNVAQSNSYTESGTRTINFVPEPSAALLGAFGALGLLRRRRN